MALTKFHQVILLALANTCYSNSVDCEQPSWLKFDNNCYLFPTDSRGNGKLSFYDAEDFCRSKGGNLASIHSQEENEFILKSTRVYGGLRWIGLNLLSNNDEPNWSDGTIVNYQNKIDKKLYQKEKCFVMYQAQRGWRPEHCSSHHLPICKKSTDPPTTTSVPPPVSEGHCPRNWIQYGQKCYRFFGEASEDRLTYKQSNQACAALGRHHDLVSIHSMEEQAFLTRHLYHVNSSAWIGMKLLASDEVGHDLVFGWVDNSRTDFTFWAKGYPPRGTWKYCSMMSADGMAKGEWKTDYCENGKRAYICQGPTDPKIPPGPTEASKCASDSVGYRNSCYEYISTPKSHAEAEKVCQDRGGHLVTINDGYEQSFLYGLAGGRQTNLWTGLQNVEGSRFLRWTDGQFLFYSNWAAERVVLNFTNAAQCASMDFSQDLKWNLKNCSSRMPFVCESSNETLPLPRPEPKIGYCPSREASWIDIGDKFCYHIPNPKLIVRQWGGAFRYCTTKGMKMLKSYSDHQARSLVSYLWRESYGAWLGLIKAFDSETYLWVDQGPLNFTNWAKRAPSFSRSERQECVSMSQVDGKWDPVDCDDSGVTVCQTDKIFL